MFVSSVSARLALAGLLVAVTPPVGAQVTPASVREGRAVQIVAGRCDGTSGGANIESIAGAAVGFAADFVIGWIGKAIEAHNRGLTGTFLATGVGTRTSGPACLRVYRGPIASEGVPDRAAAPARAAFYLEADIAVASGPNKVHVWTVTPYKLIYRDTVAATKSKTKNVSVVVSLLDTTPAVANAAASEAKAIAVFRHDFGELTVGKSYDAKLLDGTGSASAVSRLGTYNIAALVTESKDPGPALEALASSFNDNKSDLSGALADVIKSAVGAKK